MSLDWIPSYWPWSRGRAWRCVCCFRVRRSRRSDFRALRAARRDRVEADKADPDDEDARIRNEAEGGVFFLEQVEGTGIACGTVACIHAVGNAVAGQAFHVPWETPLGKYITEASKDHTPKGGATAC